MEEQTKKRGARGRDAHTSGISDRFLDVAKKTFRLYLTGQISLAWPCLAAREAGK